MKTGMTYGRAKCRFGIMCTISFIIKPAEPVGSVLVVSLVALQFTFATSIVIMTKING